MTLVKRLVKGSAITAAEHDANMDHVLDQENMVEGATKKILTAAERSAIAALGTASTAAIGDFATAAQGALADSAQQPPIEGAFVNGDKTKLDGIEALADVTDATNVGAAEADWIGSGSEALSVSLAALAARTGITAVALIAGPTASTADKASTAYVVGAADAHTVIGQALTDGARALLLIGDMVAAGPLTISQAGVVISGLAGVELDMGVNALTISGAGVTIEGVAIVNSTAVVWNGSGGTLSRGSIGGDLTVGAAASGLQWQSGFTIGGTVTDASGNVRRSATIKGDPSDTNLLRYSSSDGAYVPANLRIPGTLVVRNYPVSGDGDYEIVSAIGHAATIEKVTDVATDTGTLTFTLKIGSTAVAGISVAATATPSGDDTATGDNIMSAGNSLSFNAASSASSPTTVSFVLTYNKPLGAY